MTLVVGHLELLVQFRVKCKNARGLDGVPADGHLELLVQFRVKCKNARGLDGVPADVAEVSRRGFDEGRGIEPTGRRRVAQVGADTGGVGAVVAAVGGACVVYSSDRKRRRQPTLQGKDTA